MSSSNHNQRIHPPGMDNPNQGEITQSRNAAVRGFIRDTRHVIGPSPSDDIRSTVEFLPRHVNIIPTSNPSNPPGTCAVGSKSRVIIKNH
jgi:hypothetical protein